MNFLQIVTNQYSLNDLISKKTWLNDPKVDMYQAAVDEAITELVPSTGWTPWWKGKVAEPDFANCQMEVVDILHFHIGAAIQETMFDTVSSYSDFSAGDSEDPKLIKFLEAYPTHHSFEQAWEAGENFVFYTDQERELVCREVADLFENVNNSNVSSVRAENTPLHQVVQSYVGALLTYGARDSVLNLLDLAAAFELDTNSLATMYMAKHALNEFRTRNNYNGSDTTRPKYQKLWGGVEDNRILMDWVREETAKGTVLSSEQVLEFLANTYAQHG